MGYGVDSGDAQLSPVGKKCKYGYKNRIMPYENGRVGEDMPYHWQKYDH